MTALPEQLSTLTRQAAHAFLADMPTTVTRTELERAISELEGALPGAFSGLMLDIARTDLPTSRKRRGMEAIRILCALTNGATLVQSRPADADGPPLVAAHIVRDSLTDGSEAFGVRLVADGQELEVDCHGERNAESLAAAVGDAFVRHGIAASTAVPEVRKSAGWSV